MPPPRTDGIPGPCAAQQRQCGVAEKSLHQRRGRKPLARFIVRVADTPLQPTGRHSDMEPLCSLQAITHYGLLLMPHGVAMMAVGRQRRTTGSGRHLQTNRLVGQRRHHESPTIVDGDTLLAREIEKTTAQSAAAGTLGDRRDILRSCGRHDGRHRCQHKQQLTCCCSHSGHPSPW